MDVARSIRPDLSVSPRTLAKAEEAAQRIVRQADGYALDAELSRPKLAEDLGVSTNTAGKIIQLLADSGLVAEPEGTSSAKVLLRPETAAQMDLGSRILRQRPSIIKRVGKLETETVSMQDEIKKLTAKVEGQETHIRALYSKLGERYPEQRLHPVESNRSP
jgi:DNA-binding transcriptional MocR family regulator